MTDEVFCKSSVIERGSQSQSLLKSEGKETTGLDGQNDEFLDEDAVRCITSSKVSHYAFF